LEILSEGFIEPLVKNRFLSSIALTLIDTRIIWQLEWQGVSQWDSKPILLSILFSMRPSLRVSKPKK